MANRTLIYFLDLIQDSHKLKPKEADILRLRLKRKNLKAIGKKYKVSYERIRQIEKNSLLKLKEKTYQETLF